MRNCDFTVTLGSREVKIHNEHAESGWCVTLAETGEKTATGGRLRKVAKYLREPSNGCFMATYGDGVANIDIDALLAFHRRQRKVATVTAVRPLSRFGELSIHNGVVTMFLKSRRCTKAG